jgi:hypothetical protein
MIYFIADAMEDNMRGIGNIDCLRETVTTMYQKKEKAT